MKLSQITRNIMIPMYWQREHYDRWNPQNARGNPAWGAGSTLKSRVVTVEDNTYVRVGTAMTFAYNYGGAAEITILVRATTTTPAATTTLIQIGNIPVPTGYFSWWYSFGELLQTPANGATTYDIRGVVTGGFTDVLMRNAMWHIDIARA